MQLGDPETLLMGALLAALASLLPVVRRWCTTPRSGPWRCVVVGLALLALGRPRVEWPGGPPVVVLCIDGTASTGGRGGDLVRRLQERLPGAPLIALTPEEPRTDLVWLLQEGRRALPGTGGHLILVSDGLHHGSGLPAALDDLAAQGVQVEVLALEPPGSAPRLAAAVVPARVRPGSDLPVSVTVAGGPGDVVVHGFLGGIEARQEVHVQPGEGCRVILTLTAPTRPGDHDLVVELSGDDPPPLAEASRVTLRLEVSPARPLARLGDVVLPASWDDSRHARSLRDWSGIPGTLLEYEAVLVAGSLAEPGDGLTPLTAQTLADAVRRGEVGVILVGGEHSFGAGGWVGSPLDALSPLDPDPGDRPGVGTVVLADRSGSMDAEEVEVTRAALHRLLAELAPGDVIGVLPYASQVDRSGPLARPRPVPDGRSDLSRLAAELEASYPAGRGRGGTLLEPALRAGLEALQMCTTPQRLLMVITDAELQEQDRVASLRLLRERPPGLEVIVILTARTTGGFGPAELTAAGVDGVGSVQLTDEARGGTALGRLLARVFSQATRERWIDRGTFPVRDGDEAMGGQIGQVNRTRARPEVTPQLYAGEWPLLAVWQQGAGRVAAVAARPGPGGGWGGGPLDQGGFWEQLVGLVTVERGLQVAVAPLQDGKLEVQVRQPVGTEPVVEPPVRVRVEPEGEEVEATLIEPGMWEALVEGGPGTGTILVRAQAGALEGLGVAHRAVPVEWSEVEPDLDALQTIAAATGGTLWFRIPEQEHWLRGPAGLEVEGWPWLLLLAAVLTGGGLLHRDGHRGHGAAARPGTLPEPGGADEGTPSG